MAHSKQATSPAVFTAESPSHGIAQEAPLKRKRSASPTSATALRVRVQKKRHRGGKNQRKKKPLVDVTVVHEPGTRTSISDNMQQGENEVSPSQRNSRSAAEAAQRYAKRLENARIETRIETRIERAERRAPPA